jgi:hypothetical protein
MVLSATILLGEAPLAVPCAQETAQLLDSHYATGFELASPRPHPGNFRPFHRPVAHPLISPDGTVSIGPADTKFSFFRVLAGYTSVSWGFVGPAMQ